MFWNSALGLAALAIGCFAVLPRAQATLVVNASVGGAPIGASYISFDNLALGATGGRSGDILVSFALGGQAVQGSLVDRYAAPFLSNQNGSLFRDPSEGADTTTYLATGLGTVTLSFLGPQRYFGLLWGSVDSYNILSFYQGMTLVGDVSGGQVAPGANGNQGMNGSYYVNISSTIPFDKVVAASSDYAFEFDNVAQLPEPMTLALLGFGVFGLGFARRNRPLSSEVPNNRRKGERELPGSK